MPNKCTRVHISQKICHELNLQKLRPAPSTSNHPSCSAGTLLSVETAVPQKSSSGIRQSASTKAASIKANKDTMALMVLLCLASIGSIFRTLPALGANTLPFIVRTILHSTYVSQIFGDRTHSKRCSKTLWTRFWSGSFAFCGVLAILGVCCEYQGGYHLITLKDFHHDVKNSVK